MGNLTDYSKKDGKLVIQVGNQEIKIDKHKEVSITRSQKDLLNQPPVYSYIKSLQAKLIFEVQNAEANQEKLYAHCFLKAKNKKDPISNRSPSDATAEFKAQTSMKYIKARRNTIKIRKNLNEIHALVKAFEQRASLLQTLSANTRKEVNNI